MLLQKNEIKGFSLKNNAHFPPSTVVLGKEKYFLEGIAKGIRSCCLIKVMHILLIILILSKRDW